MTLKAQVQQSIKTYYDFKKQITFQYNRFQGFQQLSLKVMIIFTIFLCLEY